MFPKGHNLKIANTKFCQKNFLPVPWDFEIETESILAQLNGLELLQCFFFSFKVIDIVIKNKSKVF